MQLWANKNGKETLIQEVSSLEEALNVLQDMYKQSNCEIPYVRFSAEEQGMFIDVGSHGTTYMVKRESE